MRTGHADNGADGGRSAELHYLAGELAALWGWSAKTIRSIFLNEPGVIVLDREEACHKRGYRTMSIPQSVAVRVHLRMEQRKKGIRGRRP
jgi:hypothetical protein